MVLFCLAARLLVAGADLPRALEVSLPSFAVAEVPADHHHQGATVVDPQFSMGMLHCRFNFCNHHTSSHYS
jgi:hypothetical protein